MSNFPPAAFFDFDGTLVETSSGSKFPKNRRDWEANSRAVFLMTEFVERGYRPVIVTNQGGISAGHLTEEDFLARANDFKARLSKEPLVNKLKERGWNLPVYYCSETDPTCVDRKPNPGMGYAAGRDLGLDLPSSVMVGDAPDVESSMSTAPDTSSRFDDMGFAESCGMRAYIPVSLLNGRNRTEAILAAESRERGSTKFVNAKDTIGHGE